MEDIQIEHKKTAIEDAFERCTTSNDLSNTHQRWIGYIEGLYQGNELNIFQKNELIEYLIEQKELNEQRVAANNNANLGQMEIQEIIDKAWFAIRMDEQFMQSPIFWMGYAAALLDKGLISKEQKDTLIVAICKIEMNQWIE